ncbi:MAG: hypothetical protein ACKVTZ_21060 [Bacteroidia bacterium]
MRTIYYLITFLICFSASCKKEKPAAYRQEIAAKPKDTAANIVKWKEKRKTDVRAAFLALPDEYVKSTFSGIPTPSQRQEILAKTSKSFRDITISENNHYLFYSKDDGKQGMMTTITSFLCKDSSELIGVEVSKWDEKDQTTEQIHFLKQTSTGWEEATQVLPEVRLQDFFRKDISAEITHVDHNYLPVLCYELQKKGNRIKVFLGQFEHGKEKFKYKPDVDYIELEWNGEKFEKLKI